MIEGGCSRGLGNGWGRKARNKPRRNLESTSQSCRVEERRFVPTHRSVVRGWPGSLILMPSSVEIVRWTLGFLASFQS